MKILEEELKDYISLDKICEKYPLEFDRWKMEYLLRMRDKNGLDDILIKSKYKFYVKKKDFDNWRKNR